MYKKAKEIIRNTGSLESPLNWFVPLASLLCLFALLLNIGLQPLFLEEPRRTMIAMEMWANQDLIVPRQLGEYYYKKPPFFNWVLLTLAWLSGDFSEWSLRLPTILSTLGVAALLVLAGRRYVNTELGWLSAFLFICSVGVLFYFSTLAEIDLFYSFITFGSILSIFHFYQKGQYLRLFLVAYSLAAIGLLTKGLPSVVFIGVSLLVFLGAEKKWRLFFGWRHILGGLFFLLIVGSYLALYEYRHDLRPLFAMQLGESSERTVVDQGYLALLKHLFLFPLDALKDALPSSLLLIFLIRRDFWRLLRSNPFVYFSALMFIANLIPYWLAPGARQRYIYMLYPFLIVVLVYAYQHRSELVLWRWKTFQILCGFLIAALLVGSLILPYIPDFQFLPYRFWLTPLFALALGFLFYRFIRRRQWALYWLILALFLGRLIFDLTVLPQRAFKSDAQSNRELAQRIQNIVGEENLYLYCSQRISFTTVVYLNKLRKTPLERRPEKNVQDYFLLQKTAYDDSRDVYLTFEYSGWAYELVKFH